jgi:hypothetical protein
LEFLVDDSKHFDQLFDYEFLTSMMIDLLAKDDGRQLT